MSNTTSIRKGLNIRLVGEATKEIQEVPVSGTVGVSPIDFHGLTPKMVVKEVKIIGLSLCLQALTICIDFLY